MIAQCWNKLGLISTFWKNLGGELRRGVIGNAEVSKIGLMVVKRHNLFVPETVTEGGG